MSDYLFRNLNSVQRRAFERVVTGGEIRKTVLENSAFADSAEENFVFPVGVRRVREL